MVAKSTSVRTVLSTLVRELELQRQTIRSADSANSIAIKSKRQQVDRQLMQGAKIIENELSAASLPSLAVRVPSWSVQKKTLDLSEGRCDCLDDEIMQSRWMLIESESMVKQVYRLVKYSPAREPVGRVLAGLHQINSEASPKKTERN